MFSQVVKQDIQEITKNMFKSKKVRLLIQREDLNNPHSMGNKWWKLRYNLTEAIKQNQSTILTFGGAFSNHIAATASTCNRLGLNSIGIIRSEFNKNLNPTLLRAKNEGMQLQFIDRETYRNKSNVDWKSLFGDCYLLPEGGTNELAVKSCEEMVAFKDFDIVCDGTDNFETRYIINDECKRKKKTLISAAINKFDGHLYKFNFRKKTSCYRCFMPEKPTIEKNCEAEGVFSPVAGILGSLQANEVLKTILDLKDDLNGYLIVFNSIKYNLRKIKLSNNPLCKNKC